MMNNKLHGTAKFLNEVFTQKGGIKNYEAAIGNNKLFVGVCLGILIYHTAGEIGRLIADMKLFTTPNI